MSVHYDPMDWYWRADDGRVFASKRGLIVNDADAQFITWKGEGDSARGPTAWPRDDANNQTDDALQEVVEPYGVKVTLKGYAALKRWQRETSGIVVSGQAIATDDRTKNLLLGARVAANNNPAFTTPWANEDGTISELNAAQVIAISDAVLAHVKGCFARFETISDGIDAATITTRLQVDTIMDAA